VGAERHQVDLQLLHVDRQFAGRLRRVDMQQHAARAADPAQRCDRSDHADLVIDRHDRGQNGVRAQRRLERRRVEQAIDARRQTGHFKTFGFEPAHAVQHRLVPGRHGDQVPALDAVGVGHAFQGQVVRFGGARGPDDVAGRGADQRRHLAPCVRHSHRGVLAERVRGAGRVAEFFGHEFEHLAGHARIDRRGSGVIEVSAAPGRGPGCDRTWPGGWA